MACTKSTEQELRTSTAIWRQMEEDGRYVNINIITIIN